MYDPNQYIPDLTERYASDQEETTECECECGCGDCPCSADDGDE